MSISPWSGGSGLERLASSKYYSVLKHEITFNLGLNAAKNTHRIKKASNKSYLKLNFVQKFCVCIISRRSGAMGLERF